MTAALVRREIGTVFSRSRRRLRLASILANVVAVVAVTNPLRLLAIDDNSIAVMIALVGIMALQSGYLFVTRHTSQLRLIGAGVTLFIAAALLTLTVMFRDGISGGDHLLPSEPWGEVSVGQLSLVQTRVFRGSEWCTETDVRVDHGPLTRHRVQSSCGPGLVSVVRLEDGRYRVEFQDGSCDVTLRRWSLELRPDLAACRRPSVSPLPPR